MSYEHILTETRNGVGIITLNRPDSLNAYIIGMGEEFMSAFRAYKEDPDVRVIVLTGAGRAYSAGVDLQFLKAQRESGKPSVGPKLGEADFVTKLPLEMTASSKVIIAAMNGHAIGVGITMSLPCDIRIAANEAKLGLTFTKLGMLPGLGSTYFLPRLVGPAKAKELILSGATVLGEEAARIGLVNQAVPASDVLPTAIALAEKIAANKGAVTAAAKSVLNFGESADLASALKNEREASAEMRRQKSC